MPFLVWNAFGDIGLDDVRPVGFPSRIGDLEGCPKVTSLRSTRRYAHGAEVSGDGGSFRVWAERAGSVGLVLSDGREIALAPEAGGWFSAEVPGVSPGTRYAFRLDGRAPLADPASRAQVSGPDSWSVLVDATAYRWRDGDWEGVPAYDQVIHEIHVGTFTKPAPGRRRPIASTR